MPEQLRLDAVVVDRFSKPLGELRQKLQAVSKTGLTSARGISAEFGIFHRNIERVTKSLRGGLEPGLAAVGLEGLSAGLALGGVAGAVAGVVASIKNFATSTIQLKAVSQETGITVEFLRKLVAVSSQFGVEADSINPALQRVAENIKDIQRGMTTPLGQQLQFLPGGKELIEKIKSESPDDAIKASLDFLSRVKEGVDRSRLSDLFGFGNMSRFVQDGIKPFSDALAAAKVPEQTKEAEKAARDYTAQVAKLTDQWDLLSHKIGEINIPWVTKFLDDLDKGIDKSEKIAEILGGKAGLGEKLKAVWEGLPDTGPIMGKATSSAIGWLKELFGIKEAGAAELKPGEQKKPGSFETLPGAGLFRFREEIREGTKSGVIEGLRQVLQGPATDAGIGGGRGAGGGGTGAGGEWSGMSDLRRKFGHPHKGGGAGGGIPTPSGGVGSKLSGSLGERTDIAMRAAESQLLKEGVSQEHVHAAAAALIGNALGESPLNPDEWHDHRTGYGIYGAGKARMTKMLAWLKANGYAHNSLEGQTRQMAHDAMTDPSFAPTRRALENATLENLPFTTATTTRNFEAPNPRLAAQGRRIQHAIAAYNRAASENLPPNIPRPGTGYRAIPGYENFGVDGPEHRPGAALRAQASAYGSPFGLAGPISGARTGKATLEVSLKGFPPVNTKSDGGSLFDKIELDRGRSMQQAR